MDKLFKHFIVILVGILMSQSLVSCLGGDDETEIITYSDCAITSFSLGTLNRYLTTKKKYPDSNGVYLDSIYKTTYSAANVRFAIDQYKREIYNLDSLSTGTDSTVVICNISGKNNGGIFIAKQPCDSLLAGFNSPITPEYVKRITSKEIKDSLVYLTSSDSINFSVNPKEFYVTSSDFGYPLEDGTFKGCIEKYTVKLNIHKEDSLRMTWSKANECSFLKEMTGGVKVVSLKDNVLAFGNSNGGNIIYATGNTTDNWKQLTPNVSLPADAYKNLAVCKEKIYAIDADQKLIYSEDAENWNATGITLTRLYGASSINLYGLDGEGELVAVNPEDMTVKEEGSAGIASSLPDEQYSICTTSVGRGMGAENVVIVGLKDSKPTLYTKTEELLGEVKNKHEWYSLNTESNKVKLPDCQHLSVNSYGSYVIALVNNDLYTSEDKGLTWRKRYFLYVPAELNTEEVEKGVSMAVDSKNTLWIFCPATGRVWHGKLNGLAWKTTLDRR